MHYGNPQMISLPQFLSSFSRENALFSGKIFQSFFLRAYTGSLDVDVQKTLDIVFEN